MINSIYDLMGTDAVTPLVDDTAKNEHIETVLKVD